MVTGVQLIGSTANLGLAGAGNRGRQSARGDLLVLLHDDAEIEPGWLEALVETADAHPEAGVVGGKVLSFDGELQNAGMILWSDGTTAPPWTGEPPSPDTFDRVRPVDYCGTSSLLVRASIWDAIGGLDERFYPVYFVDVDLALAVRELGRSVLCQPRSRIRHHRGASGSHRWRHFVADRNRHRLVDKWGAVLDRYEPVPHSFDSASCIARAIDRAEMMADGLIPTTLTIRVPTYEQPADRHYLALERSLRDDYIAQLIDIIEQTETLLAHAAAAAAADLAALRSTTAYLIGTRLTFHTDGTGYRYSNTGGHPAEPWGTWLGISPFTIALPVVHHLNPGSRDHLRLLIEGTAFITDQRTSSRITVRVAGAVVAEIIETRPGQHAYDISLGAASGYATNPIVVTITGENAVSPAALGLSADARPLSFGLVAISLTCVAEVT
jgi:hypothetical protein